MKRFLTLMLMVCGVLFTLPSCGREPGSEADLVFVNQSDAVIVEVVVKFQDRSGGSRNADGSPLRRGESFGFEAGEYPVTVYVYDKAVGDVAEGALARLTIREAPRSGERWYVAARDGAEGLTLITSARMPDPDGDGSW